jgi:hypothetical protein
MKTVFAFTQDQFPLPAYANLSKNPDGTYNLSVRAQGEDYARQVVLDKETIINLKQALDTELSEG